MGTLIDLQERLADRSRPTRGARPAFFFDLACPYSYLAAERAERLLGDVEWIPAAGRQLRSGPPLPDSDADRERAEHVAALLRLPLVWPERFPSEVPRALRAASYAGEIGAGPQFALAAARLAFCGGFDLEDPEVLAEAAAAAASSGSQPSAWATGGLPASTACWRRTRRSARPRRAPTRSRRSAELARAAAP